MRRKLKSAVKTYRECQRVNKGDTSEHVVPLWHYDVASQDTYLEFVHLCYEKGGGETEGDSVMKRKVHATSST